MFLKQFYYLLIAAFILIFYVWQQNESMRLAYTVEKLEKECAGLEQSNDNYRLRVNQLVSLERLNKVADKKGLVSPDKSKSIYLPK